MNITFPTRNSLPLRGHVLTLGAPKRAVACHCLKGSVMSAPDDTCVLCGHYNQATISQTWADRARKLAQHPQQQLRVAA